MYTDTSNIISDKTSAAWSCIHYTHKYMLDNCYRKYYQLSKKDF